MQSDGNRRLLYLGHASFLISFLRAICYRQVWICMGDVELTPKVYFVYRLFKVYLTMIQKLRLAWNDGIVTW
jgi:hypothetical protein